MNDEVKLCYLLTKDWKETLNELGYNNNTNENYNIVPGTFLSQIVLNINNEIIPVWRPSLCFNSEHKCIVLLRGVRGFKQG